MEAPQSNKKSKVKVGKSKVKVGRVSKKKTTPPLNPKKTFNPEQKKALASLVSTYPCIWKLAHPLHKDPIAQLAAWESIAAVLKETRESTTVFSSKYLCIQLN